MIPVVIPEEKVMSRSPDRFGWCRAALLVVLSCGLLLPSARAELPSVRELIRETKEACEALDDELGEALAWPLSALASAQAYAGDYEGAVKTARSLPNPFQYASLLTAWEIHFRRTGKVEAVPVAEPAASEVDQIWFSGTAFQAAECLTKAGRDEEARKLLPSEDRPEHCVHFFSLHLSLAEHFVNQGDRKAAGERLKQAFAVMQRYGKPKSMRYYEQMVRLGLRIGDREQAMVVRTEAVRFVRDRIEKGNRSTFLAEDRARVAKCHALLGDDQAAREAFADAVRIAIEADQRRIKEIEEEAPEDPDERKEWLESNLYYRRHLEFTQALGRIGAWQFSSGYPQAARETYAKAIERIEQLPEENEDRGQSFPRRKLMETQCEEGDIPAALRSLQGEKDPYWKLLGYCTCASKLADGSPNPWVTKLILQAESLVQVEKRVDHRGWMLEKLAELKAQAGDSEGAKKTLNEALAASKANGGKNFQAIARTLIRQGRLEEAYRTIREIPGPEMRLLPLAELTLRAAKEEDARKRK
jgi:hypothetical protein